MGSFLREFCADYLNTGAVAPAGDGASNDSQGPAQQPAAPPQPTAVAPGKCPVAGGTKVIITGSGFTGATSVAFDKLAAQFVVDSDTQITATTPDSTRDFTSGSDLSIIVTTPAGSNPQAGAPFVTFGDVATNPPDNATPPQPTAVAPGKCPAAGGTKVIITGSGFTGATSVAFDKLAAQFVVDSDTQITATTPDSTRDFTSGSDLSIIVTTPAGSNPQAGAPFVTFGDVATNPPDNATPPQPTAVAPGKCPAAGGTKVIITGSGFTDATSVAFDKLAAQFVVDSDTQITATTPDSTRDFTSGSDLSIIVTTPTGSNPQAGAPFVTFGDVATNPPDNATPPQPTAVAPGKCPAAGGTKVIITGSGFTGATSVAFDKLAAQFVVDSDTQITATTPDSTRDFTSGSDLSIIVTTPAGSNPQAGAPFVTFGDVATNPPDNATPPQPTAVAPGKCPAAGGTKVIITGSGFTGATSVAFDKLAAQFVVDSDTQITATTPDSTRDFTSGSDLSIIVTTPAGSNPQAGAPFVTFGDVATNP